MMVGVVKVKKKKRSLLFLYISKHLKVSIE